MHLKLSLTMTLRITTPTGITFEGEINCLQFTSATGLMEFLPGHAPMIAEVKAGVITANDKEVECGNGVVRIENDKIEVVCE